MLDYCEVIYNNAMKDKKVNDDLNIFIDNFLNLNGSFYIREIFSNLIIKVESIEELSVYIKKDMDSGNTVVEMEWIKGSKDELDLKIKSSDIFKKCKKEFCSVFDFVEIYKERSYFNHEILKDSGKVNVKMVNNLYYNINFDKLIAMILFIFESNNLLGIKPHYSVFETLYEKYKIYNSYNISERGVGSELTIVYLSEIENLIYLDKNLKLTNESEKILELNLKV